MSGKPNFGAASAKKKGNNIGAEETNWKQKFQKPLNENICLTNLNLEKNDNFPILAFGDSIERMSEHAKQFRVKGKLIAKKNQIGITKRVKNPQFLANSINIM